LLQRQRLASAKLGRCFCQSVSVLRVELHV
jgi:hypothetical protein